MLSYPLNTLGVVSNSKEDFCEICVHAKQTRSMFPISQNNAKDIFYLIHCDIWGSYRTPSSCGAHYFLSIVDDTSRATWIYLMKDRTEASKLLRGFIIMVKNQFNKGLKVVRSDHDVEFTSGPMQNFYHEHGILRWNSCVDILQQNGRVKRKHRHTPNVEWALWFQANLQSNIGDNVYSWPHIK